MKIAVSGKGGSGKTTVSALLARTLAGEGRTVFAVDADPTANLGSMLGLPRDQWPVPISQMKDLIKERTGTNGNYGTYFKINPDVRDLPDRFSRTVNGVRLLTLGGVAHGGAGCICPESALLKSLITHLLLRPGEFVVIDMEAGIEHLGRATAQAVTIMLIVVNPGQQSIQTAQTIRRLARDIQITRLGVVLNKVTPETDVEKLIADLDGLPVLGRLSYDPRIVQADIEGASPFTGDERQSKEIHAILNSIAGQTGESRSQRNP